MSSMIYVHGYQGTGGQHRVQQISQVFPQAQVISPSYGDLALAYEQLSELLQSLDRVLLIGSSLGGYLSSLLHRQFGVPAIVFNPVCDIRRMNRHPDWVSAHSEQFLELENRIWPLCGNAQGWDSILALTGGLDDVVPSASVLDKYPQCISIPQMEHQVPNLEPYLRMERVQDYVRTYFAYPV